MEKELICLTKKVYNINMEKELICLTKKVYNINMENMEDKLIESLETLFIAANFSPEEIEKFNQANDAGIKENFFHDIVEKSI